MYPEPCLRDGDLVHAHSVISENLSSDSTVYRKYEQRNFRTIHFQLGGPMKHFLSIFVAFVAFIHASHLVMTRAFAEGSSSPATFHLIVVNEVYTNADGTRQYVELMARSSLQTNLAPTRVNALEATGTIATLVFDFTASFPLLDNNETILLATQGVADDLGFSPDFLIPSNTISLTDGRVAFAQDPPVNTIVDAVAYGAYTGDNSGYGSPAAALPSDGSQSLNRIVYNLVTKNNATDFALQVNSPTRNDGMTGTLLAVNEIPGTPNIFSLQQNFPNPFNPRTVIRFDLPASLTSVRGSRLVVLKVYDLLGQEVATLVNEELKPGSYEVAWDAAGKSSGVYFYRLQAGNLADTKKLLLLR